MALIGPHKDFFAEMEGKGMEQDRGTLGVMQEIALHEVCSTQLIGQLDRSATSMPGDGGP
jgi:hypothetical protein